VNESIISGYIGSKLKFQGFSNVEWSEGTGYDETTYSAAEYYFKIEQPLVQGKVKV
jgi:hypothetical protein